MIWNVFLDMVAMLIALCLIVVVFGFGFWALAWIVRLVRRSTFIAEVGRAFVEVGRAFVSIFDDVMVVVFGGSPEPDPIALTWCQGCDELVKRRCMAFTELGLYRCNDCRGIEMVTTDGRPISTLQPGPGLTTSKYMDLRCDVCEGSAPEWFKGRTNYRCAECRGAFPAHLPATAEEWRLIRSLPVTARQSRVGAPKEPEQLPVIESRFVLRSPPPWRDPGDDDHWGNW